MVEVIYIAHIVVSALSLLFLIFSCYYLSKIRRFTLGFKGVWTFGIFGMVFLILLSIAGLFVMNSITLMYSVLTLFASIFFSYGSFKLSNVFKEVSHKKTFNYAVKN